MTGPPKEEGQLQDQGKTLGAITGAAIPPAFALCLIGVAGGAVWLFVGLAIAVPSSLGLAWAGAATVRRVEAAIHEGPGGHHYRPEWNLFWWSIGISTAIPLALWLAYWLLRV